MAYDSEIRCETPSCKNAIEKYGEHYHSVSSKYLTGWPEGTEAYCEKCGGSFDGNTWNHQCIKCGKVVPPGELKGLFVPHNCEDCQQKIREEDVASGRVCRSCRKPYSSCCC